MSVGARAEAAVLRTALVASVVVLSLFCPSAAAFAGDVAQGAPMVQGALPHTATWMERGQALLGIPAFLGVALLLSVDRRAVPWRLVGWGLGLQFTFALLVLRTAPGRWTFQVLNDVITQLLAYSSKGATFLFGNLAGHTVPAEVGGVEGVARTGAFFAFSVLPTIIFFSALMAVLYHIGLMPWIVDRLARVMQRTLGTSGAESLSAASNIFVGQTEAPLVIRPFVARMTRSELAAVMTGGFATIAGGVMAAYVGFLSPMFPNIAGHLLAASVMSAPAALVCAKIVVPETGTPETLGRIGGQMERIDTNVLDAAGRGATEGMMLCLNVAAMLIAFLGLIAVLDGGISFVTASIGLQGWDAQRIVGLIFIPAAWLMGIPAEECSAMGRVLGVRWLLNEFVGYMQIADMGGQISTRATILMTYAMCGFANFGSIGIQIGGISALAPERRGDLANLALRAMIAGTLASFLTACVVGVLDA